MNSRTVKLKDEKRVSKSIARLTHRMAFEGSGEIARTMRETTSGKMARKGQKKERKSSEALRKATTLVCRIMRAAVSTTNRATVKMA